MIGGTILRDVNRLKRQNQTTCDQMQVSGPGFVSDRDNAHKCQRDPSRETTYCTSGIDMNNL